MKSRKIRLLITIIVLATLGAFAPPLICWLLVIFMNKTIPSFAILTDGDWITVISIIVPAYMGALTWEKHIAISNGIQPKELNNTCSQIKDALGAQTASTQSSDANESATEDADKEAAKNALKHGK